MVAGELLLSYDALFVDLYGVIWGGNGAFPSALDALEKLVAAGKEVVILSNASTLSPDIMKKYDAVNLRAGVHFTHFITSGDVLRQTLLDATMPFATDHPLKYFLCGYPNDAIFEGSTLERTENLDEADFVYLSIPRFFDGEREAMDEGMRKFLFVARSWKLPILPNMWQNLLLSRG
jgi:ribonucleotide monophosphatase NagD (HAD superfamily)